MSLNNIFIDNLKYYRDLRGYSQEKLADKSNLHRTYISLIERNKRNITIKNIEKLALALEVEPYELLKRKE